MRIESNRKVPQTNRLSLGVLDMDGHCESNVKQSPSPVARIVLSSHHDNGLPVTKYQNWCISLVLVLEAHVGNL